MHITVFSRVFAIYISYTFYHLFLYISMIMDLRFVFNS